MYRILLFRNWRRRIPNAYLADFFFLYTTISQLFEMDLEEEIPLCYACRPYNRAPITLLFLFPKRKKTVTSLEQKMRKGMEGGSKVGLGEKQAGGLKGLLAACV